MACLVGLRKDLVAMAAFRVVQRTLVVLRIQVVLHNLAERHIQVELHRQVAAMRKGCVEA